MFGHDRKILNKEKKVYLTHNFRCSSPRSGKPIDVLALDNKHGKPDRRDRERQTDSWAVTTTVSQGTTVSSNSVPNLPR